MSLNFPYQNHYSGVIRRHSFQTIGNRLKLKKWFSVYPYHIGILHANHCSKYLMVTVRVKLEKNLESFKSFSNFKTNEYEVVWSRCSFMLTRRHLHRSASFIWDADHVVLNFIYIVPPFSNFTGEIPSFSNKYTFEWLLLIIFFPMKIQ